MYRGEYWHQKVNEAHQIGNHRFIRGNHDDPGRCRKEMCGWIPDGTVENGVMFIGGAYSIDSQWRTEGEDWWRDEECDWGQFYDFMDIYEKEKPRVMITHDCPTEISYRMFVSKSKSVLGNTMITTRTGQALQSMFEMHQPEHWFFGHWHHTDSCVVNGTKFQCLAELDYLDVDL